MVHFPPHGLELAMPTMQMDRCGLLFHIAGQKKAVSSDTGPWEEEGRKKVAL